MALFGMIAGSPAHAQHFAAALRGLGAGSALLWLVALAVLAGRRTMP